MAQKHLGTLAAQSKSIGGLFHIRTGDRVPLIEQYFSDTAHTRATNTHEVDGSYAAHLWHLVLTQLIHGILLQRPTDDLRDVAGALSSAQLQRNTNAKSAQETIRLFPP